MLVHIPSFFPRNLSCFKPIFEQKYFPDEFLYLFGVILVLDFFLLLVNLLEFVFDLVHFEVYAVVFTAEFSLLLQEFEDELDVVLEESVQRHIIEKLVRMKQIRLANSFVLVHVKQVEKYGLATFVVFCYEFVDAVRIFFGVYLELEVVEVPLENVVQLRTKSAKLVQNLGLQLRWLKLIHLVRNRLEKLLVFSIILVDDLDCSLDYLLLSAAV